MFCTNMHIRKIIIVVVVSLLAVLMAIALRGRRVRTKINVVTLEKDIREHLPIGSTRAEVSAYLDQRKIEHSHVGEVASVPENKHKEMAIIRDVSEKGLVRSDIQILFKFDDADSKLVSYSVREIFTGP